MLVSDGISMRASLGLRKKFLSPHVRSHLRALAASIRASCPQPVHLGRVAKGFQGVDASVLRDGA